MLTILTICISLWDLRRWENGLSAKTKRITDKLPLWHIPVIFLMTFDTMESSLPLRLSFVYHDSVNFLISVSKWFGNFVSFSAWWSKLCETELKAFLSSSQTVTRLRRINLTSFRMLLVISSCSTVPHTFFFPATCSGVTILFLYTWSIRYWLTQLLYRLYVTLRHAMGRYFLAICVSVLLGNNTVWAALSHVGSGESKWNYWLNKTDNR